MRQDEKEQSRRREVSKKGEGEEILDTKREQGRMEDKREGREG